MAAKQAVTGSLMANLRRWAYNKSGFNKYGLKAHDCLDEGNELVKEALRRLPNHIQDERNFRIIRAMQCSIQKIYLPENQWQKYEEDDYYMQPYLDEVQKEFKERMEWAKK